MLGLATIAASGVLLWFGAIWLQTGLEKGLTSALKTLEILGNERRITLPKFTLIIPGSLIWVWISWYVAKNTIVICKQFTKSVVNDPFTKHSEVYGGMEGDWGFKPFYAKITFPTIDLRGETMKPRTVKVPCKDGSFKFTYSYLFKPRKSSTEILTYVEKGEEDLEEVFDGIMSGLILAKIGHMSAPDVMENIGPIRREIETDMQRARGSAEGIRSFEDEYAVDVSTFQITEIEPSEETAIALADPLQANQAAKMFNLLTGGKTMSEEDAAIMARMLVGQGDRSSETIRTFRLNPEAMEALRALGPTIANNPALGAVLGTKLASALEGDEDHGGGHKSKKDKPKPKTHGGGHDKGKDDHGHGHGGGH
jgi:hypothetical protein